MTPEQQAAKEQWEALGPTQGTVNWYYKQAAMSRVDNDTPNTDPDYYVLLMEQVAEFRKVDAEEPVQSRFELLSDLHAEWADVVDCQKCWQSLLDCDC